MEERICYHCFSPLKNREAPCPHCGYDARENAGKYPLALPEGSILNGRYIVGRTLGQGGFGITYVAQEVQSGQRVAIKEFFPETMATRSERHSVMAFSGQRQENFTYGLQCFLSEAQTLAQFIGTENIVRVHSYFEENGTAYFVMDYVDGVSFQTYLKQRGGKISWEEAKKILFPIMDALSIVHSKGIIHRDIAPDNIYITSDGTVKLLDFGAARYSLGDKSRSLDVVLKAGYAPKEQYTRRGRQGPYTDIYSLAATCYNAITGRIPPEAIDRMDEDDLVLPSSCGARLPLEEEDALEKALSVQPYDRFQTMAEFRAALGTSDPHMEIRLQPASSPDPIPEPEKPVSILQPSQPFLVSEPLPPPELKMEPEGKSEPERAEKTPRKKRRIPGKWLAIAAAALLAIVLGFGMWISGAHSGGGSVMMADNKDTTRVLGSSYLRGDISKITFLNSTRRAPSNSWDVSEAQDGSVLAWVENRELSIACEGGVRAPSDCSKLFAKYYNLVSIDFNGAFHITSDVTKMDSMFLGCSSLKALDVRNFDTSRVTTMAKLFQACSNLNALDLSSFDTSNVKNMSYMFWHCDAELKLGIWEVDSVQNYTCFMKPQGVYNGKNWTNLFKNS